MYNVFTTNLGSSVNIPIQQPYWLLVCIPVLQVSQLFVNYLHHNTTNSFQWTDSSFDVLAPHQHRYRVNNVILFFKTMFLSLILKTFFHVSPNPSCKYTTELEKLITRIINNLHVLFVNVFKIHKTYIICKW